MRARVPVLLRAVSRPPPSARPPPAARSRGRRLTCGSAEAADFIQTRCEQLQARADKLSEEASDVNSQIEVWSLLLLRGSARAKPWLTEGPLVCALLQVVLRGLQELMQISDPAPPQARTFL